MKALIANMKPKKIWGGFESGEAHDNREEEENHQSLGKNIHTNARHKPKRFEPFNAVVIAVSYFT
jgi:hypothetical protein